MRRHGLSDAYERLKDLTRGRQVTREALLEFIRTLDIPEAERSRLLALEPSSYIGLAPSLARDV
jgi:adenylosuccinate lyase